jgi:hypothetical protein
MILDISVNISAHIIGGWNRGGHVPPDGQRSMASGGVDQSQEPSPLLFDLRFPRDHI